MERIAGVALGLAWLVGCGGANSYHCDFRMSENPDDRCQERTNSVPGGGRVSAEGFKATCEAAQGDGGNGLCPRDGAVLGCDFGAAGAETVADWYYEPMTREAAELECENDDGTFIEP